MTQKQFMESVNPAGTQNERELWHGTSPDALDEIHATGFNRSFCGKNGEPSFSCFMLHHVIVSMLFQELRTAKEFTLQHLPVSRTVTLLPTPTA